MVTFPNRRTAGRIRKPSHSVLASDTITRSSSDGTPVQGRSSIWAMWARSSFVGSRVTPSSTKIAMMSRISRGASPGENQSDSTFVWLGLMLEREAPPGLVYPILPGVAFIALLAPNSLNCRTDMTSSPNSKGFFPFVESSWGGFVKAFRPGGKVLIAVFAKLETWRGKVTSYDTDEMLRACLAYKRRGTTF